MCEKQPVTGPGLAYSSACSEAIINMSADTMGLYPGDPSHFSRWVASNHPQLDGARYPPRRIYGQYLVSLFQTAKDDAVAQGIHLEVKEGELIDLCLSGDKFVLRNDNGGKLVVDRVVLALGNFTACTQSHLIGHAGYVDTPWPLHDLSSIPAASRVCVVGSRLSGLDVVLHLAQNDHKGPIYLASRSGCLPSVQSLRGQGYKDTYKLHLLARDLECRNYPVYLDYLAQRLMALVEDAGISDWDKFFHKKDPLVKLSQDISDAENGTNQWRALADAIAPNLERYWSHLTSKDQLLFLEKWCSMWYTYVHAMPYENALKLQNLLRSKAVNVLQCSRLYQRASGFTITSHDEHIDVDFVVEATGFETNVSQIRSPFLHSILQSRILEAHPVTGLSLDQHTLESTTTPGIYAIGSLSTGVHFYTNGIDRNVAHASRISRHLVGRPVYPPAHVAIILPDGGMGWAGTLCRAITTMVQSNMIPFLYRSVRQCCSREQGSTSSDEFHCGAVGMAQTLLAIVVTV
ncbi:hypothetical protein NXS19_010857 [Fusarium pseudograminearum]|nr:hypothetical protein NXS19_010857 [Fusarium pseudograminearum]